MVEGIRRRWTVVRSGSIVAVALVAAATVLGAAEPQGAAEAPGAAPAAKEAASRTAGPAATASPVPAAKAGFRAYIDPATGKLTPIPPTVESRRLSQTTDAALSRTSEDLVPFPLSSGGTGVFLEGRFQSATVARVAADGTIEVRCVETPEGAESFLEAPVGDPSTASLPVR